MTRRSGMTLVELVVGLAIAALVAGGGYGALTTIVDRRAALAAAAAPTVRAAAVRHTLLAWLEGIELVADGSGQSFVLVDRQYRGVPDDELTFITTARTPLGGEGAIVTLRVEHAGAPAGRGLVALLQERGTGRTMRLVLDSTVTSLRGWCISAMLPGTRVVSSWVSPAILPRGVELRLGADDGRLDPLLALPIVVPIPGGR